MERLRPSRPPDVPCTASQAKLLAAALASPYLKAPLLVSLVTWLLKLKESRTHPDSTQVAPRWASWVAPTGLDLFPVFRRNGAVRAMLEAAVA